MHKGGVEEQSATERFETLVKKEIVDTRTIPSLREIGELEAASARDFVDGILQYAYLAGTSDIHLDPSETLLTVRFRMDGILHDVLAVPKKSLPTIVTRIRVLSELRTDVHQSAQDGRFRVMLGDTPVDVRVSITPTFNGETVVMRLLVSQGRALQLSELGMSKRDQETIERNMKKSYGMLLATGPTGSGKTTSLYSMLQELNKRQVSIITIEDPVEYTIPGLNQIQVNTQTDLTFASGLRSIVRQDPNIIMVGEIRDQETAGIAVNAALTGHLLLSTLHTNDAAVALPRLVDMGIEPFLIASTINVAIGQRLVRRLCTCAKKRSLTIVEREALKKFAAHGFLAKHKTFAEPKGCAKCNRSGYHGRIGIYEVLEMTEKIRGLVVRQATADDIRKAAISEGMTTMLRDGLSKAASGITSIAEVLRVIHG